MLSTAEVARRYFDTIDAPEKAFVVVPDAGHDPNQTMIDAIVKLHAAGLLPTTYALARLGYDATQIEEIRAARRAEALDTAGLDLRSLV